MPVNFQVDWEKIKANKQNQIQKKNDRENLKRKPHQYSIGNLVTVIRPAVTDVHDNGTLTIQNEPFVMDRVNIRRVQPFHTMEGQGNA